MPNHRDCRGLVGSDKSLGGASCTARQTAPVAACRPPDPERNLPENAARRLMCSPEVREKSVAVLRGVFNRDRQCTAVVGSTGSDLAIGVLRLRSRCGLAPLQTSAVISMTTTTRLGACSGSIHAPLRWRQLDRGRT